MPDFPLHLRDHNYRSVLPHISLDSINNFIEPFLVSVFKGKLQILLNLGVIKEDIQIGILPLVKVYYQFVDVFPPSDLLDNLLRGEDIKYIVPFKVLYESEFFLLEIVINRAFLAVRISRCCHKQLC